MKKLGNIIWGLAFIGMAVLLLMSSAGYTFGIGFGHIIFSVIWGALIITSICKKEIFGVTIGTALMLTLWDEQLGIEAITPAPIIIAAVLVAIGWDMIFKKNYSRNSDSTTYYNGTQNDNYSGQNTENNSNENNSKHSYGNWNTADNGECIRYDIRLSGGEKYVNSQNLRRIDVSCKLGGAEIYLNEARAAGNEIIMNIDCVMGGVDIFIPRDWNIDNQMNATLGGVDEHRQRGMVGATTLVLLGSATMGGIDIKRV